jgi:hypothetical protein
MSRTVVGICAISWADETVPVAEDERNLSSRAFVPLV